MTIACRSNRSAGFRVCLTASLLVAAASMLGGCSSSSKSAPKTSASAMNSTSQATTHDASGMDIYDGAYAYDHTSLVRGQTFTVRLPSTVGSHYDWRLSPESASNKSITLLSRKSQQVDAGESNVLDSACWDVFTFRANRLGETQIEFMYDRPFHTNHRSTREFSLSLDIAQPVKGQMIQHASVTVN